jgi:hypothetical protein
MMGMGFPRSTPAREAGLVVASLVLFRFHGLKAVAPEQGPKTNGRWPPDQAARSDSTPRN